MLRRLPLPRGMSPEGPFEARYFIALVSNNGSVEESDISSIISVDKESVESYVKQAFESNNDRGFIGQFRFVKQSDGIITRIIFLSHGLIAIQRGSGVDNCATPLIGTCCP